MSGDWTIRDYLDDDENCVASMWLKSYAHSSDMRELGLEQASVDAHPDEIRHWRIHQPIVTALIRGNTTIRVACDPERADYESGAPAVIWAWACFSGDVIHYVGIKRSASKAGLAPDLARALLGDKLDGPQRTTFDLVDLARLKLVPQQWRRDRGWLSALRSLSTRVLDQDPLFTAVGAHVLDTQRQTWAPKRAA